jgi:hypothetical protein
MTKIRNNLNIILYKVIIAEKIRIIYKKELNYSIVYGNRGKTADR